MLQWEGEREQFRSISFSIGYFFILDIFVALAFCFLSLGLSRLPRVFDMVIVL